MTIIHSLSSVILTPASTRLTIDTSAHALFGNIQPGVDMCGQTTIQDVKIFTGTPACKFVRCSDQLKLAGHCERHDSVCWVDRAIWNPDAQDNDVGYQHAGYPNVEEHMLEGRKLTLLVLHALEEALSIYETEMREDRLPLADNLWHVGPLYEKIRESVRTLERLPGESARAPPSPCEQLLNNLDPRICHLSMHVLTEWTPRVTPLMKRLKRAVVGGIDDSNSGKVELYSDVDLLPPQWEVPLGQVDVHMIAIATNDTSSLNGNTTQLDMTDALYVDDDRVWNPSADDDCPPDDDSRRLVEPKQNNGWSVFNAPIGFCDGSAQSRCNRIVGNKCLLANYNHFKAGILGDGASDWLTLSVGVIKEGIILARFEFEIAVEHLPDEFQFEYSIDGTVTRLSRDEFVSFGVEIVNDLTVYPLLMNKEMSYNMDESEQSVAVGIRFSSSAGSSLRALLTHVYFA